MDDEDLMKKAIDKAREGIAEGQTPFGACIVKDGSVVACEHNTVWKDTDITSHAEIHAIRSACRKLETVDLSGCVIYSTTEPCPMCFSAIHWAGIRKIVFGTRIEDAKKYGFSELEIPNEKMKELGNSKVEIVSDLLRDENVKVFEEWAAREDKKSY